MPDSQIDFSDIPEATDAQLKRMRRVGRPSSGMAKQLIAIRLSPGLESVAENGRQAAQAISALIHELSGKAVSRAV